VNFTSLLPFIMIAIFKKAEVREDLMFVKDNLDRFRQILHIFSLLRQASFYCPKVINFNYLYSK
jgi:hypothetical protein